MLHLQEIRKSYRMGDTAQEVLKGISVQFRRSEFAAILGSSGSGKTTLLNIIGGLDHYDDGDLLIDGISTQHYRDNDWDAYRNYRVGFIFQSYNLIMHQTVFSNVEIALTLSGISKEQRRQKVLDVLEKVGLQEHVNKMPNQLSGGQMQRVAIARALVNEPEIILADEPTGALDSVTSIQIMDLLKEIAQDKLIIMVTHNPELADTYASRIIELKDGQIVADSNPYVGEEQQAPALSQEQMSGDAAGQGVDQIAKQQAVQTEENPKRNAKGKATGKKTSMSFRTTFTLSLNNLLTKKKRTFMTALAGSIGIIGIALILSLANGVNGMVSDMEKDSLSDYPITIEKKSLDLFGTLSVALSQASTPGTEAQQDENALYSKDDLVSSSVNTAEGLLQSNDTKAFKEYLEKDTDIQNEAALISYNYDLTLQVFDDDGRKVNPFELAEGEEKSVFQELTGLISDESAKTTMLAGTWPAKEDEVVLLVGKDHNIPDSILYALGVKDIRDLEKDLEAVSKDSNYKVESSNYSYGDFIGRSYKVILNTDYYQEENGTFQDRSNDADYMKGVIETGMPITIVGVAENEDVTECYVGYLHDLTLDLIQKIDDTDLAKAQLADRKTDVLTGASFDSYFHTYDDAAGKLGIYDPDEPSSISIYPKDFDAKQAIVKNIDAYNAEKEQAGETDKVVHYTDMMKSLVSGIKNVVNVISFVLVAFVAISLIVSSIMISIITYISVLERTKEIGILRAIGASKKDIRRVFTSETMIEGLFAGVLGVGITILLCIPINMIVGKFADIQGIAKLPIISAIVLILLSVLLNVLAGHKPSRIAAWKDPVEALRTE